MNKIQLQAAADGLLINPRLGVGLPVAELLGREPKCDILVGAFDGVRSVANVAPDINAIVASDGPRQ